MQRPHMLVAALVLLILCLSGCRTAPVYNVESSSVPTTAGLTQKQVGDIIEETATKMRWNVERSASGQMVATLNLRGHRAVVDILYDTRHFSVRYKDSADLDYDGEKIHRQYNSWIVNLERRVKAALLEGHAS